MKNLYFVLIIILVLGMMLIPLTATGSQKGGNNNNIIDLEQMNNGDGFLVYDPVTKEITSIPEREYILGVVAAEMPATYQPEALKAQVVASYTYACHKRNIRIKENKEYDLSADSAADQGYVAKDKLSQKWGDNTEEYTKKLEAAVDEVLGYVLTYNNQPIFAAYHAISGGKTESANNVWGTDYPYLQPVDSVGDLLCSTYLSEAVFSPDEFAAAAKEICALSGDPASWVGEIKRTSSGTVASCTLGGQSVTGKQMRGAFNLRSANFDLVYENGNFKFTVRGYGHGVGMSQYGANYMALQGANFMEILAWYYKDCTLQKIK